MIIPPHAAIAFNPNATYLIEPLNGAGVDLNAQADGGVTTLHLAVLANNLSVVTTLLDADADPGIRTYEGELPLHVTGKCADSSVLSALPDAGSEPTEKDVTRKTAFDCRKDRKRTGKQYFCLGQEGKTMGTRISLTKSCLAIVALALMATLSTVPRAAGFDRISCYSFYDEQEPITVSGIFLERESGRETRLFLAPKAGHGCVIRFEDGGEIAIDSADYTQSIGVCRDVETGSDNAIVLNSAGQYHNIQIWSVDPESEFPVLLYSEPWSDEVSPSGFDLLVSSDGACRWRGRRDADQTFLAAMAALRIDTESDAGYPEIELPTRPIAPETARHWLNKLKDVANLEGAIYADEAGANSWRIIQVFRDTASYDDAGGVVLVFDRQKKSWQAIFNLQTGYPKELVHSLRGMIVEGDTLIASLCLDCFGWGLYFDHAIDLRSYRARIIEPGDGTIRPSEDGNKTIHGFDYDSFLESDP
ncbi:MAG: hypothetical protein OXF56_23725 [Rhodobacteraceae bacterium]|nr:hypothetical protein [Paracoccaceae bacterium]